MRYIGVDHHKKYSYFTVMDEVGRVVKEGKVENKREEVMRFLDSCRDSGAMGVIEAGRNWTVMYDWLEEELDEVKLAHPLKVKAIASAKIKTDRIDSEILAHLLRSDLIPESYVPTKEEREVRNVLRQRYFLVRFQTMIKNRIHTILDRHPEAKGYKEFSDIFGVSGRNYLYSLKLPYPDNYLLKQNLSLLEVVQEKIKSSEGLLKELTKKDNRVKLLQTVPGIGEYLACLIVYEIGDIKRFGSAKQLCSYAGIVPGIYASGNRIYYRGITHQGNKFLRWAIIESVWPATRTDLGLKILYERLKREKGANTAKVAVGRKVLTIIYRILKEGRSYYKKITPAASYVFRRQG
ncbi:MAG: IS110 family transposase [Thermodesulfovibrionales bacterium]